MLVAARDEDGADFEGFLAASGYQIVGRCGETDDLAVRRTCLGTFLALGAQLLYLVHERPTRLVGRHQTVNVYLHAAVSAVFLDLIGVLANVFDVQHNNRP